MSTLRKKLLVADDDPNIQELLKIYLLAEGFEVDMAGNGAIASNLLRLSPY